MMDYQTAVRGAFFDIAGVAETPDEVAAQARYLDDGLLFLQDGKIVALLPWQEGE
ncbi:TPA: guanine deaminase, partial [Klebsiella pneumoniae]|nr:guanine deaminase [Klebsiella pneumoniae]